jgi:hypothetical protein
MKTEPIKGLRKTKLSAEAGGLRTSNANEINPRTDAETKNSKVTFNG